MVAFRGTAGEVGHAFRIGVELLEASQDRLEEAGLVAIDGQDVVGLLGVGSEGNLALANHRVQGDDVPAQFGSRPNCFQTETPEGHPGASIVTGEPTAPSRRDGSISD